MHSGRINWEHGGSVNAHGGGFLGGYGGGLGSQYLPSRRRTCTVLSVAGQDLSTLADQGVPHGLGGVAEDATECCNTHRRTPEQDGRCPSQLHALWEPLDGGRVRASPYLEK